MARSGDMDQASPVGEAEVHSDGDQSTDTDEEGVEGSTMLTDKHSPIPQISFEADKNTGHFPKIIKIQVLLFNFQRTQNILVQRCSVSVSVSVFCLLKTISVNFTGDSDACTTASFGCGI